MDIKNNKPTVEQLQELTDAELSQAVLIKLHPKNKNDIKPDIFGNGSVLRMGMCDKWVSFDIKNWPDMGLLANKYKIGAIYSAVTKGWAAFYVDYDNNTVNRIDCYHENELRAKAIVFLMMEI